MGADMTLAVCRDIHFFRGAKAWLDRTALEDRGAQMARHAAIERGVMADRVARLDPLPDNYEDLFFWHDFYLDRAEDTEEPEFTPEEVRTMILDGISRVFEHWRDTTTLFIEGKTYLATGGLSWGDPPTEAYDPIIMVDSLGLFDKPVLLAEVKRAAVGAVTLELPS